MKNVIYSVGFLFFIIMGTSFGYVTKVLYEEDGVENFVDGAVVVGMGGTTAICAIMALAIAWEMTKVEWLPVE